MPDQPPFLETELCDELVHFTYADTPTANTIYLGIAYRDMWLQRATLSFGTASNDLGNVNAYIAKIPNGSTTPSALMSLTAFDLKGTANTYQTAEGTTNEINKGDRIALIIVGTIGSLANLTVDILCTTRRM